MNKLKITTALSLSLNVILLASLLILALAVVNSAEFGSDIDSFSKIQARVCGVDYPRYLKEFGESEGEQGKKNFALTTCLRNYKTGQQLDLKPLEDQIH